MYGEKAFDRLKGLMEEGKVDVRGNYPLMLQKIFRSILPVLSDTNEEETLTLIEDMKNPWH